MRPAQRRLQTLSSDVVGPDAKRNKSVQKARLQILHIIKQTPEGVPLIKVKKPKIELSPLFQEKYLQMRLEHTSDSLLPARLRPDLPTLSTYTPSSVLPPSPAKVPNQLGQLRGEAASVSSHGLPSRNKSLDGKKQSRSFDQQHTDANKYLKLLYRHQAQMDKQTAISEAIKTQSHKLEEARAVNFANLVMQLRGRSQDNDRLLRTTHSKERKQSRLTHIHSLFLASLWKRHKLELLAVPKRRNLKFLDVKAKLRLNKSVI